MRFVRTHHPVLAARKVFDGFRCSEYSNGLAEFVGIILGDGGASQHQVVGTLHAIDDREYGNFVVKLIKKLFEVPVGIYPGKKDSVLDYVVSRTALVRFLATFALRQGNKAKQRICSCLCSWTCRY